MPWRRKELRRRRRTSKSHLLLFFPGAYRVPNEEPVAGLFVCLDVLFNGRGAKTRANPESAGGHGARI
jgi:hypothetical protein